MRSDITSARPSRQHARQRGPVRAGLSSGGETRLQAWAPPAVHEQGRSAPLLERMLLQGLPMRASNVRFPPIADIVRVWNVAAHEAVGIARWRKQ